jgi:tripartite-type tricarboxylate transporter receptor subunit TctC
MLLRLTMRTHRVQIALVCVVAAVGLAAGDLAAQPYPAKAVRVVIPAAPGSNTDVFFRIGAQKIGSILGQQLVAITAPVPAARLARTWLRRARPTVTPSPS